MVCKGYLHTHYNIAIICAVTSNGLCKRQFKNLLHQIVKELKPALNLNYSYLILTKDNALKKDCFLDLKKAMFTEFNKIR